MSSRLRQSFIVLASVAVLSGTAGAQDMTSSDVTRLQQTVDAIGNDLLTLRQRDRNAARALQAELTELEDEVTYLKVRLRRERNVPRSEFMDVRDRLDNLRQRVRGEDTSAGRYGRGSGSTIDDTTRTPGTLPTGTEIDLRLESALSSETNQVEDRFEATTAVDIRENGRVIIPAGSRVRGVVTDVEKAGRIERKGRLSLSFDQITIGGRNYAIRGSVVEALESGGYREDAEKIGAGAAIGGIIGGILGGLKGAVAGVLIGGGGVVAATEGQDVELAPGTVLRMRLDQPLETRSSTRQ